MSADNPFLLPPRSVISFSGGRTSGLMLRRILDAFGGKLPDDRKVIFCNTGKEREETLEFVERCSQRWDVPITWLEYQRDTSRPVTTKGRNGQPSIGRHGWKVVNCETASRNGGPFDAVVETMAEFRREAKGRDPVLPNPVQRFCTGELKTRTMGRYLTSIGWDLTQTTDAIGLPADEPKRISRLVSRKKYKPEPWACGHPIAPLGDAGITEQDVMDFWSSQQFDLKLKQHEGNCDLCFLKSSQKILAILRDKPELASWWIAKEESSGQEFRKDRPSVSGLLAIAQEKQTGPGWLWSDNGNNGSCGEIDECRCTD